MENSEGTHIMGNVSTDGGDFIGRDKIVHGDEVHGDKVTGHKIVYEQVIPRSVDAAMLKAANTKLAKLPVNRIPSVASLPTGSRMPLGFNPLFVGRETDLRTLAATLKRSKTVAVGQIAAATGLGGIGKTQLAVAFVHHYGQFFLGGVQWLSFADANAIPAEIAACGAMMPDLRADFATLDLETQIRLVLAAWQSPLPRLLVFDNCEEPALLAQWRPPTGGSQVLVTSRRHTWDAILNVSVLALDILARPYSIELLRKFRPDLATMDSQLDQIATELGDLPLALHLAGSYLARYRHAVSPAQYLAQLRQPNLLQHRSLQVGDLSPTGHVQHVARTFALSYERLHPTNPLDALAQALLARAAWFAPGQLIPRALLLATIELNEEESALQAADALQQLANLGLLEMGAVGDLWMHRLVAHFVQPADAEAGQMAQRAVAAALLKEADRINNTGVPGPLIAWQSHLRHIVEIVKNQTDEQSAELCAILGFHLHMIGDFVMAKSYYERALAIWEAVLGDQHSNTATINNNLGSLLQAMGELPAAKPYLERALAIYETVLGKQHPYTATSYNNLGMLLQLMGEFANAKPYYERALAIRETVLGEQHQDTATSYNNLGMLLQAMGEFAAAKPYLERSLAICQAVLGDQHPDTAASYNNLGRLLQDMSEFAAAKPYLERALPIREAILGGQHPETAVSYNSLGMLFRDMGELSAAKNYLEHALAIWETVLGEQHPYTASGYNNLGLLFKDMGELPTAKNYLEHALAIRKAVLGEWHPDTAQSYNNLGTLLQSSGDLAAAKTYYERALTICEKSLGPMHPYTGEVQSNLADLELGMKQNP